MLQPDPQNRLGFAEVVDHEWTKGEIATHDHVRHEMERRSLQKTLDDQKEIDLKKKKVKSSIVGDTDRVYMSGNLEDSEKEEEYTPRPMKILDETTRGTYMMFCARSPAKFMSELKERLEDKMFDLEEHEKKWKLKFIIRKDQEDDEEEKKEIEPESC
jgi:hypothetical protein